MAHLNLTPQIPQSPQTPTSQPPGLHQADTQFLDHLGLTGTMQRQIAAHGVALFGKESFERDVAKIQWDDAGIHPRFQISDGAVFAKVLQVFLHLDGVGAGRIAAHLLMAAADTSRFSPDEKGEAMFMFGNWMESQAMISPMAFESLSLDRGMAKRVLEEQLALAQCGFTTMTDRGCATLNKWCDLHDVKTVPQSVRQRTQWVIDNVIGEQTRRYEASPLAGSQPLAVLNTLLGRMTRSGDNQFAYHLTAAIMRLTQGATPLISADQVHGLVRMVGGDSEAAKKAAESIRLPADKEILVPRKTAQPWLTAMQLTSNEQEALGAVGWKLVCDVFAGDSNLLSIGSGQYGPDYLLNNQAYSDQKAQQLRDLIEWMEESCPRASACLAMTLIAQLKFGPLVIDANWLLPVLARSIEVCNPKDRFDPALVKLVNPRINIVAHALTTEQKARLDPWLEKHSQLPISFGQDDSSDVVVASSDDEAGFAAPNPTENADDD